MRVAILTNSLHGIASIFLPLLASEPTIEIAMVILSEERVEDRSKHRQRKFAKMWKIGILGALNGIRMREWYRPVPEPESLETLAKKIGIPFERTLRVNYDHTRELLRKANVDLGLSLGNSYIAKSVFSIPSKGMINVHHELLPEFQGAQSVVWQLHEGSARTGFTIHQVEQRIDGGKILAREVLPIEFKATLRDTVIHNVNRSYHASARALVEVLKNFETVSAKAAPQQAGKSFTTPTFSQFLKMKRQHERLRRK